MICCHPGSEALNQILHSIIANRLSPRSECQARLASHAHRGTKCFFWNILFGVWLEGTKYKTFHLRTARPHICLGQCSMSPCTLGTEKDAKKTDAKHMKHLNFSWISLAIKDRSMQKLLSFMARARARDTVGNSDHMECRAHLLNLLFKN